MTDRITITVYDGEGRGWAIEQDPVSGLWHPVDDDAPFLVTEVLPGTCDPVPTCDECREIANHAVVCDAGKVVCFGCAGRPPVWHVYGWQGGRCLGGAGFFRTLEEAEDYATRLTEEAKAAWREAAVNAIREAVEDETDTVPFFDRLLAVARRRVSYRPGPCPGSGCVVCEAGLG